MDHPNQHTSAHAPGPLQAWISALRPRTLVAGVVPVGVGTALAMAEGQHHPGTTLACVAVSLLLQVGVNLHNDHADASSGADTEARLGPARATAQGWITPATVLRAAYLALALAGLVGLYLVSIGGWPILAAGIASVLAALAYTGGPFPLGYRGLGEVLVFTFFGLVATAGTFFLHTGAVSVLAVWAASAIGALA
ncbi:MAG: 1,4-dihydroxy-2-naphthoate octaprenyltransferase, partial [Nannocystaceae bacterium]